MTRHTGALSVLVTAVLALALIVPTDTPVEGLAKPTLKRDEKKPAASTQMTSVTLPPPPALKTPAPVPIITPHPVQRDAKNATLSNQEDAMPVRSVVPLSTPHYESPIQTAPTRLKPLRAPVPAKKAVALKASENQQPNRPVNPDRPKKSVSQTKNDGRPLLKLLEFGEGPNIEIAWPDSISQRARLFDVFRRCYGMQVALMNASGDLYIDHSPGRAVWAFDTDKFSRFVRLSQGRAAEAETTEINAIRNRHGVEDGDAVRLFPRETDALLLGGLHHLIGAAYNKSTTIHATYRVSGQSVHVTNINSDGLPVRGAVDLSGATLRRCGI